MLDGALGNSELLELLLVFVALVALCVLREKQSKARRGEARQGRAWHGTALGGGPSVIHSFIHLFIHSFIHSTIFIIHRRQAYEYGWMGAAGSIASHCIGIIGYWQLDGKRQYVKYTEDGKRREKRQEIMG